MKKTLLFFVILSALVGLGLWQIARLQEKNELIGNITAQLRVPAVDYNSGDLSKYKYRRVSISAKLLSEKVIFYYRLNNNVPGYELLVPAVLSDGKCLLVDLGWQSQKSHPKLPDQEIVLEGVLAELYGPVIMSPNNSLPDNIWFDLDVKTIENHIGVSCAPYLLVLYSPGALIVGKNDFSIDLTNVPNNHLSYAITWFLLAGAWVVVSVFYMKRKK